MAGLFQAVAVRCGGFQIVVLGNLAPAVQVLYVVMMSVSCIGITAMPIRDLLSGFYTGTSGPSH